MDIYKAIEDLKAEKKRLDRAIEALEQSGIAAPARKGRKSWDAESRRAAGERMKKYWEKRRQSADSNNHIVSPPSTESA